jgi:hypothetical protein
LKRLLKILLYGCLIFIGLCLLAAVSLRLWLNYEYHLPPEQRVRKQFEANRADYIQFVTLLQRDPSAHYRVINGDGRVYIDGVDSQPVPEYEQLIRKLGVKFVTMREDGSIEFSLYGFGCAICSDSYLGVSYVPKVRRTNAGSGWEHTAVASLDNAKLPQENGGVATGLYVVPIEPEWFVYRFEHQE